MLNFQQYGKSSLLFIRCFFVFQCTVRRVRSIVAVGIEL